MNNCVLSEHRESRVRRVNTSLKILLLGGASALAIGAFGPAAVAQTTSSNVTSSTDQTIETVVVTGRREAIQSAQKIKEKADQIVDAIVADDAGKLPDNSVTEVLARIPGVSITHFAAPTDPDHYSIEGSGVAVRGLTEVNSTLNGREDFSATGGRALLWEDVPPELMASVEVYKSSTPDQIEGGIGGSVNLRTHMPFDYDKLTINGSVSENYGDFVNQERPAGSVLVSDRWQTGIGEIGLLLDVAYSNITSRYDTMQMEPYNLETLYDGHQAFVPGGFDWRTSGFDRKRVGLYEALQWRPTENLMIYQTAFQSYYNQYQDGIAAYNANGSSETVAPGTAYKLNSSMGLVEADSLIFTGWNPLPCPSGTANCSFATTDTGASKGNNRTTDLTEGFNWDVVDNFVVSGALQYVKSTSDDQNMDIFPETVVPSFGFSLAGGGLPNITVPNSAALADPANYIWEASMDHIENHTGQQIAGNADAEYTVSDTGFLRAVKLGMRYANLTEKDDVSGYNWTQLTPGWYYPNVDFLSNAQAGDVTIEKFPNFFRGEATLPGAAVVPSLALVNLFNTTLYHQRYGEPGDTTTGIQFLPQNLTISGTETTAADLMADFGRDSVFGMPMDGNIGVRVVNNKNTSQGFIVQSSQTIILNGTTYAFGGGYVPNSGSLSYTKALPSFNIQFMPRDDIHLRFAASQSLTNPSFGQLTASGGSSLVTCPGGGGGAGVFDPTGACLPPGSPLVTGYGGDPKLKPQISNNVDMSLEWYGQNQSAAHIGFFYKAINDYLEYGTFNSQLTVRLPDGTSPTLPFQVTNFYNASTATVRGFELGATKFFDFLPDPFDGLGVDANFTYIDSRSPGDQSCQLFPAESPPPAGAPCGSNQPIHGLPVEQLSKYNYNLTGMYEKGPWSARLAYNWRSQYLLVASGANGTGSLPVFSAPYGQLDFGSSYRINDHFTFGVDGQNVTATVAKTLMGVKNDPVYGDQQYNRNWFVSDRRFIASIKFSY